MIAIVFVVIILVVVSRYDDPILVSAYDDLIPAYDDLIPDHDDSLVVLYTSNCKDNHDTRNSNIGFKSTNHNLLKWLCILPSSSIPSSIVTLSPSSSSSSQSSISLCKYDSNSVIYHKQQYYKRIQQNKRKSRQSSSSSSSSSIQSPSKKVKLSIILDFDGIRNRMSNSNDNNDTDASDDNGIINDTNDTRSDDDNIISNAPINNNMIPIGNIYNSYKSVLISFIKGNSININSNSGNMITYYNDDNSNSISNNNGNMISYYNDNKIQRLPVLFNDIVAADTYYLSHVKESSLAFYNSYANDSSNKIVVVLSSLLSSVLLLVIVYISGALTVLLFQSIYTTSSPNNTDVDESIQQFEKKALAALETGDIGQVREIVAQAVAYINQNKNKSALDVAAFKHILGRAENIGRNFDRAEPLLKEVKELYEDCDTDDLYGTVLEDYADSLRGQGRTDEAIESMHMAAAVFDEIKVMEDYLNNDQVTSSSSSIPAPQHVEEATKSMSPGSKELSDYLDSFSNIYNTNTTNNVFGSNISNTNNINISKGSNGSGGSSSSSNSSSSSSSSSSTPTKPTYRHHLIRCTSKQNRKASSPSDLDDFYDFYDDDSENINPNIANTNANTSITYSIKPNSNPILKPKLKPKRPLQSSSSLTPIRSSPSSSFFHNTDKTVLSPKTPISKQPPKKEVELSAPAILASSTPAPSSTLSSTSAVKSPFDTTKDLCLSVSTNSVRVRSNIGKMMMEEHRYSDANDIFNSVLETCKFLSNQNIDVENIIKEVTQWKSQIISHTHNVVRIDSDDD